MVVIRMPLRQIKKTKTTSVGLIRWGSQNIRRKLFRTSVIVQELCESRGGRPGLSVLTSLLVSVDVKIY